MPSAWEDSGGPARSPTIPLFKKALGASERDVIVGFLYLGNVATAGKDKEPDPEGVVTEWNGLPQSEAPPT